MDRCDPGVPLRENKSGELELMIVDFGFSYVGLSFLVLLFVPNLLWTKNKPKDYDEYVHSEKKILLVLERTGQVLVCGVVLSFSDFNIGSVSLWSLWLLTAVLVMALYEAWWIRYFRSKKTMQDFYSGFLSIPVAGATLPVIAFLLLGIYGKNPFLLVAVGILGVGHIGIHLNHRKEVA